MTMPKIIKTKESLLDFDRQITDAKSINSLDAVVAQYYIYNRYKEFLNKYYRLHGVEYEPEEGGQQCNKEYKTLLSSTDKTVLSIALRKYFSLNLNFSDSSQVSGNKSLLHEVKKSARDKFLFLDRLSKNYHIGASLTTRGVFIRCNADDICFYIISLKTPIDAIYLPKEDLVYYDTSGLVSEADIRYFLGRVFNAFCKENDKFLNFFNASFFEKKIAQVARVDRPYHVFADEFSGNYYLNEVLSEEVPIVFSGEASFFEQEDVLTDQGACAISFNEILFCYQKRLDFNSAWGRRYLERLQNKSVGIYGVDGSCPFDALRKSNVVWITITGGEKPRLKNELEFIRRAISFFDSRFDNCFYIFDGYTKSKVLGQKGSEFIAYHRRIVSRFVTQYGLESRYISLVGEGVNKKIFFSTFCDYVISSGTPLIWSSNFNDAVCVVHGGEKMLKKINEFTRSQKLMVLDGGCKDWEDKTEGLRFDRVTYSLDLDRVFLLLSDNIRGCK